MQIVSSRVAFLVPLTGLEPVRYRYRRILSPTLRVFIQTISIYQYFKYLCAPKKGAVLYSLVQTGFRPYKKKKISSE